MRVLVAEDDSTLRESVAELLRAGGHDVVMVADGAEAIRQIEAVSFDLAFVDWNMPGKNGGEVLRRAREVRPRTAVVVMTGYGNVDTAVEAMRSGAKDFLQKPFEAESLEQTMKSIQRELASRRRTASGEASRQSKTGARSAEATAMKAAFLHSKQGLLIASKVRPGQKTGDEDLLVATLNIIQNFMRISFPMLKGKRLRSISQGDHTLVTEAGKSLFLTVVIRGDETRGLRPRLREILRRLEEHHREIVGQWERVMSNPKEAVDALSELLEGELTP